jgi:class 3 adenylate cyclase
VSTAADLPRGTVTFLFTDIEGSTDLARKLGPDFGGVRSEHRKILREAFDSYSGHEIDTAGDGFFVAFERAADAVHAAVDAQRTLRDSPLAEDVAVRVRMGIHSAEPYLDDDGYTGVGVHRAARICAAGHGGQILLSNATAGIVEDLGADDVRLRDLGEHRLKDLERPQRLFQLTAHDLPVDFPPLKSLDTDEAGAAIATLLLVDVAGWYTVIRTLGDERSAEAARNYHRMVLDVVSAENGREIEVAADNVTAPSNRVPQRFGRPFAFERRCRPNRGFRERKRLRFAWRSTPGGSSTGTRGTWVLSATASARCAKRRSPVRFWSRTPPRHSSQETQRCTSASSDSGSTATSSTRCRCSKSPNERGRRLEDAGPTAVEERG